jgi:hypothetical protein
VSLAAVLHLCLDKKRARGVGLTRQGLQRRWKLPPKPRLRHSTSTAGSLALYRKCSAMICMRGDVRYGGAAGRVSTLQPMLSLGESASQPSSRMSYDRPRGLIDWAGRLVAIFQAWNFGSTDTDHLLVCHGLETKKPQGLYHLLFNPTMPVNSHEPPNDFGTPPKQSTARVPLNDRIFPYWV